MASYTIDNSKSRLVVTARSGIHNTDIRWVGITGKISVDLAQLEATQANIAVDMRTADAGDWLKNRKLKKDMNFERHPEAKFVVTSVHSVQEKSSQIRAIIEGELTWRGKTMTIKAQGGATVGDEEIVATGSFDLDMTKLGITPPKILMLKVQDIVTCEVSLFAKRNDPKN